MNSNRTATRHGRLKAAFLVGALAMAGTALFAQQASAAPQEVTGGSINWGVKESFRNYISIAGTISLADGATVNPNGSYRFGVGGGSHDTDTSTTTASSSGSVKFFAHEGVLEMTFSNIRVAVNGSSGQLIADVLSRPFSDFVTQNPLAFNDDVVIGNLNLTGITPTSATDSLTWTNVPVAITQAGVDLFGPFYTVGQALDPVSFTLLFNETGGGGGEDPVPQVGTKRSLTAGALNWAVSEQVWSLASLNQCREVEAPATINAGTWAEVPPAGFVAPADDGTYDTATGQLHIDLGGSFIVGNRNQGNYRLRLANLAIDVDADGDGTLTAEVSYSLATSAPVGTPYLTTVCETPGVPRVWTTPQTVVVVTFDADPANRTFDGNSVAWSFTPPWADVGHKFAQTFIDSLDPSLQGHFQATGAGGNPPDPNSASNLRKPPATLRVTFEVTPPQGADDGVDIVTTVQGGALAISIANDQVVLPVPVLDNSGQWLVTSGQLGAVTVVDTRTIDLGWNVNAQVSAFNGADASFSGSALGWTPSLTSASAGQVVHLGSPVAPGVGLLGATLASTGPSEGRGTAVLGAQLQLRVPTSVPPGTYTATLTLTAI